MDPPLCAWPLHTDIARWSNDYSRKKGSNGHSCPTLFQSRGRSCAVWKGLESVTTRLCVFAGPWSASKETSRGTFALGAARKAEKMLRCGSAVGARPFTTAAEHARRSIGQNTRVCAERRQDQCVERGKAGAAIKIVVRVGGKKWRGSRKGI